MQPRSRYESGSIYIHLELHTMDTETTAMTKSITAPSGRKRSGGQTLSHHGREFSTLRAAAQKFVQRNETDKLVQVMLELSNSDHSLMAYKLLAKFAVEEKFPHGAEYLFNMSQLRRSWGKYTLVQQNDEIAQMCYNLTQHPTNRYAMDAARVAMELAKKDVDPETPELRFMRSVERMLLTMRKDNEIPTPNDLTSAAIGMNKLKQKILGDMPESRTNQALFDYFQKTFTKEARVDSRPYLYNLVGRKFHPGNYRKCGAVSVYAAMFPRTKAPLDERIVYDKSTTEGQRKKRGWKHFINVTNETMDMDVHAGLKRKANSVRLADERKYGTKAATPECERKRIRATFNELDALKGRKVVSSILCQKPTSRKPRTQYVELDDGNKYFLKGPFKTRESLEFQVTVDGRKREYGLTPMDIEIIEEGQLFYLCSKIRHPYVNMVAGKSYTDDVIWELVRILVFRYAFSVSDSNLRNIMIWSREEDGKQMHTLMSVDEMDKNKTPSRSHGLMYQLFNLPPRKAFIDQVRRVIDSRREEFIAEVKRYGVSAQHLLA